MRYGLNGWYVRNVLVQKIFYTINHANWRGLFVYCFYLLKDYSNLTLSITTLMTKVSRAQIIRIVALLLLVFLIVYPLLTREEAPVITSFQECMDAGYPIMESYPRQCNVGGNNFVEDIAPIQEPGKEDEAVFCTMDAKICPDGSAVGRS